MRRQEDSRRLRSGVGSVRRNRIGASIGDWQPETIFPEEDIMNTKLSEKLRRFFATIIPKSTSEETGSGEKPDKRFVPTIHPVLFALFPGLALYAKNIGEVNFQQLLQPLGIALLSALVTWGVASLLTRNWRKGAIAASALTLVYFSYSHLFNLFSPSLRWSIVPLCVLALSAVFVFIARSRGKLIDATSILNFASVVAIAPSIWTLSVNFWQTSHAEKQPLKDRTEVAVSRKASAKRKLNSDAKSGENYPDIYYLILDAYGRADSLKTFFGYDNSGFIKELEKRGFYIAAKSRANYNQTPLCLASSLNFSYLDQVPKEPTAAGGLEACRQMLDDNEVAAFLSKKGYRYVSIGCGVGQAKVETADVVLNQVPDIPEFENAVADMSIPAPLRRTNFENRRFDSHRQNLRGVFDNLDTVAQQPYQKFVFAHVLAPHPPFVFGANGESVYPKMAYSLSDASMLLNDISKEEYKLGYVAQLKYVNQRTLQAIDAILKQSKHRPVIVLQGDHGSRLSLDWESLEKTDVREPFSILNAYLVPSTVQSKLYQTITPVNSFPVVLDGLFDARIKRQPDRSFYSTADQPMSFTDVTEELSNSKFD